ncbi:hypothetical protein MGU_07685 [Metarhizium guizhouense ARSEF 977]|uniref:Uncharacterized protein n=1 Tax=Metarhizium guizhouense (strain ARSEF 977) TaxID=1276136 RepID=A0A0B4GDR7_METGA|nr:hypothetical protein MGU_07685 [Metarhizium guizhouense ARSEF 977]
MSTPKHKQREAGLHHHADPRDTFRRANRLANPSSSTNFDIKHKDFWRLCSNATDKQSCATADIKRCITASAVSFARVPGFILGFVFGFVLGFVLVLRIVHLHGFTSFNAAAAAGSLSVSHVEGSMADWVVCSPLCDPALPAEHDFCNAAHRFPYIAGRAPRDSKSQQSQQSIGGE